VYALGEVLTVQSDNYEVPLQCSNAVMTSAPTFLTVPKGSAKYPFSMKCTSPNIPGIMKFNWEGSWTPSENRRDRPNASETLTITGYEPFLPGRAPGGKIFMYWTGSCTADPWLQGGTCSRFGEYMPDDLRAAFPNVGRRPFPITGNSISPTLKQQLNQQYQAVNSQASARSNTQQNVQNMVIQAPHSQSLTQAQRDRAITVQPQVALPKTNSAVSSLSRSGVLSRGVETEDAETSDMALTEKGSHGVSEQAMLTLDRPIHFVTTGGDTILLSPGTYEVGPVLDIQLGLAREGQPTLLLHALRSHHSHAIQRTIAMAIPGQSDRIHLVVLTPDGRRFDAQGSTTGIKSRAADGSEPPSEKAVQDALHMAAATAQSVSSACQPNPADIGPRWIPVPCTMPAVASGGTP
jgi:hypothetical protein